MMNRGSSLLIDLDLNGNMNCAGTRTSAISYGWPWPASWRNWLLVLMQLVQRPPLPRNEKTSKADKSR